MKVIFYFILIVVYCGFCRSFVFLIGILEKTEIKQNEKHNLFEKFQLKTYQTSTEVSKMVITDIKFVYFFF